MVEHVEELGNARQPDVAEQGELLADAEVHLVDRLALQRVPRHHREIRPSAIDACIRTERIAAPAGWEVRAGPVEIRTGQGDLVRQLVDAVGSQSVALEVLSPRPLLRKIDVERIVGGPTE